MSVSVDIPGYGHFDIPLAASRTAGDILLLLREHLPDSPWHGNKVLSSGVCQLQCDDVVEAPSHSTLVLTNYSEVSNQETPVQLSSFFFSAERFYNTEHPKSKVLAPVAKHNSIQKLNADKYHQIWINAEYSIALSYFEHLVFLPQYSGGWKGYHEQTTWNTLFRRSQAPTTRG